MSGSHSKRKGSAGEREFAKLTGGEKMPLSGAMGGSFSNDVVLPNGMKAEVKRRAKGFTKLYEWIEDEREKPDLVAFRADRKQWVISMTLPKFLELMGGGMNERRDAFENALNQDEN